MFSRFFIDRPVFATVLAIVIVLAGMAALRVLPVAQYPEIVPPEVSVRTSYPGASAEVIAEAVAAPLEQQINGVDNMIYMHSSSDDSGSLRLTVTFETGTDPDQATIDVNNRVQSALAKLPAEVRQQGVNVQKRSSSVLLLIALTSPGERYDPVYMSNYALLNVIDALKRVPGVGDAALFGAQDYAMRVWLRPDKLAEYRLTPADVARAIEEQNAQFAAGKFGAEPTASGQAFTYTVTTRGRFAEPEEFEDIILRARPDGSALRLGDVARIDLGAQDYAFAATYNGQPTVPVGIYLQPGANALETAAAVKAEMQRLAGHFPAALRYDIPFDTTSFVNVAIHEVVKTFVEALLLVIVVVYLFLQNPRATLIPLLAIPVSIIGTFAGMYALGFSINMLTLFGMVLAIGIVVDDAIIVIENVERLMTDEGLGPRDAAIQAMHEVAGPVMAVVLVLAAVFVPVGFLGGLAGEMYRQFAITIAVSVAISGLVALTLTPALCALFLRHAGAPALPFRWFNRAFARVTAAYLWTVRLLLRRAWLGIGLFAVLCGATLVLLERLPQALVPQEDQGYVMAAPILPEAAALSRTEAVASALARDILEIEEVAHVVSFAGFDLIASALKTNVGAAFVTLEPWEERTAPQSQAPAVSQRIMARGAAVDEARVLSFTPPPIRGISTTGGFEAYLQNTAGAGPQVIERQATALVQAANDRAELSNVRSTLNTGIPRYRVDVDREKAKALEVPIDEVFAAMQSTFGAYYVNDFTLFGRNYQVRLQAEAEFRDRPEDLRQVFVRSSAGAMIPLSSLIHVERTRGPDIIDRFNVFPAAKILGDPAPGYSSGQALAAMQQVAAEVLDDDHRLGWTGAAYQELATGQTGQLAFGFGLVMVFLILAAQYERWSLPLAVVSAVPFAVCGAALAVLLRGTSNDLFFQIGLLVLIGLAAKNAILIVEFAVLERQRGRGIAEAAREAARLRFRPIVMTSLAFIVGCIPLALSSGAGAGGRQSIGTGVIGGMLFATVLAPLFVPLAYRLIEGSRERLGRRRTAPARATGSEAR